MRVPKRPVAMRRMTDGDDEPKADRDEGEEHDQLEGVEDDPDEIGVRENADVVPEPDPLRGSDAVPAVERVLERQRQREQDEGRVHEERGRDEKPADEVGSADPAQARGPQVRSRGRALVDSEETVSQRNDPRRRSLGEFLFVLGLDGLEQAFRSLLAADHLLQLGRPALGEDRARSRSR